MTLSPRALINQRDKHESVSAIAPPPCQRRFQNRFRALSPSLFLFLLVRPVHVDVFVINTSRSCSIWFFNLVACSGKYSLFYVSCNRRFGWGGAIAETLMKGWCRSHKVTSFFPKYFALKVQVLCMISYYSIIHTHGVTRYSSCTWIIINTQELRCALLEGLPYLFLS